MSEPGRNEISVRLRRLPVDFLVALINATAILVIVAAILALVAIVRIDNFAGSVVATMTEAVLAKIDLPSKDVLANLRNLTGEVRTLGNTLREIKVGENPAVQFEIARLKEALTALNVSVDRLANTRTIPHRRSDWTTGPSDHRHTDEDEGLYFQRWPNAALSQRPRGRNAGHRRRDMK